MCGFISKCCYRLLVKLINKRKFYIHVGCSTWNNKHYLWIFA